MGNPTSISLAGTLSLFMLILPVAFAADEAPRSVSITGNTSYSESTLRALVKDRIQAFETERAESHIDDICYHLKRFYRNEGFYFVDVKYEIVTDDPVPRAIIHITEGKRVRLGEVNFKGCVTLDGKELGDIVIREVGGIFGAVFSESALKRAFDKVLEHCDSLGFVDARIVSKRMVFGKEGDTVAVEVNFEEGLQFHIGSIQFHGNQSISSARLLAKCGLKETNPFSMRATETARSSLLNYYARKGFPFAKVDVISHKDCNTCLVTITFVIEEGPEVRIRNIAVEGNELTRERFIRKFVHLEEGDIYNRDEILASQKRLLDLGIFTSVTIETKRLPDEENIVDLTIRVKEEPPGDLRLKAGYGSYERLRLGAEISYDNLFGTGRKAGLKSKLSMVGYGVETEYVEPRLLNTESTGTVSFFGERRQEVAYEWEKRGMTLSASRHLSEDVHGVLGFTWEHMNILDIESAAGQVEEERARTRFLFTSIAIEDRDDPFNPTTGSWNGLTYEYGGHFLGGDVDFYRVTARSNWYFPIADGAVLGISGRGGIAQPIRDTDVLPIWKRFFSGGEASVRGFEEGMLGPIVAGKPLGGEVFLNASVELRVVIWEDFEAAVFFDTGNVWAKNTDFSLGDLRYGTGLGIRYVTPVGPLRLDCGLNPARRDGEDSYEVYFSVGYPF